MKIRIHFTPPFTIALLLAAGWFALWLFVFQPAPLAPAAPAPRPEVARLVTDDETLRKLKLPTQFALPSDTGFSGKFLENQIKLPLTQEKTNNPARYLSPEKTGTPGVNITLLTAETSLPESSLSVPGTAPRSAIEQTSGTQLFLSPELKPRADDIQFHLNASSPLETVRVNLTVRPDGTVESAFFEMPVTNAALLSAVRQIPFKPAKEKTEGWIDIRFAQEEKR